MQVVPSLCAAAILTLTALAPGVAMQAPSPQQQTSATAMTVGEFVDRWAELKPRLNNAGTRDQALKEAEAFLHVLGDAGKRYKDQLEADKVAGRTPRACPEKGSKDTFQVDDFVAVLASRPRDMPLDRAFFDFMDERHPCP
ncbi:MAG: hypothetical protein ACOY45_05310 [Pseudomonadota bacterium]